MKQQRTSLKLIALLLSFLMMQGCKIYDKPISLTEAVSVGKPVKIISKSDEKYIFRKIYFENHQLIGVAGSPRTVRKLRNQIVKGKGKWFHKNIIAIQEENISTILMYNKTNDMYNRGLIVGGILVFIGVFLLALSSWGT